MMNNTSYTTRINFLLLVMFSALALIGVLHHEIWLDEAHHWLLARDSQNLKELWVNTRYEGHPILWNFVLFIITRFSSNVLYMQFVHVAIAIISVYIFLFFSPFKPWEKLLFILGYFILYEYTVISRNYALLMLFLFLSLVLYRRKNYLWLGLALAILANTHLLGLVISSCFVAMAAYEFWSEKKTDINKQLVAASVIFFIGVVISLWQIIPPADSNLISSAQNVSPIERIGRTSTVFLKGFVPIPDFTNYQFWNTNLLMAVSKPLCVVLSFVLFLLPLSFFKNRFSLLLFFYSNVFLLIIFFYVSNLNAARYYGVIYLIFFSCMWLNDSALYTSVPKILALVPIGNSKFVHFFFKGLLLVQAFAGITGYTLDIIRPFSGSREAAELILQEKGNMECISGGCGAAPISAYLGRKIYYLDNQGYGSFCYFNKGLDNPITGEAMLKEIAIEHVKKTHQSAFLISHGPIDILPNETPYIKPFGPPAKSALRNENYYIYILSPGSSL